MLHHLHTSRGGEGRGMSIFSVVHEFEDVFPKEVPWLLPNREVEFSIDLVLGTSPVSMAPYRMALTKLVEHKNQIEELLGKQLNRPNTSPWETLVLLLV